jgi:hypothetical protein
MVEYDYEKKCRKWKPKSSNTTKKRRITKSMSKSMLSHILPSNYPESVQIGYAKYSMYAFLANSISTATMVLSTQQLLVAVGVGTASAAPISATLNWIIKDGIGQFGGILFASKVSNQNSLNIDNNPKRYRMISSFAMDVSSLLEVVAPLFPRSFLFIASMANIGKNIAFLTASASRAKLHQELSRSDNLGDITAKATSQSILSSLLGTGVGICISPFVLNDFHSVLPVCIGFACINQLLTYASLQAVVIDKMNQHRLNLVLHMFFKEQLWSKEKEIGDVRNQLHPRSISHRERFVPFFHDNTNPSWMVIDSTLDQIFPNGFDEMNVLLETNDNYILNCTLNANEQLEKVHMIFLKNADFSDTIKAQFQAHIIHAHFDPASDNIDLKLENNVSGPLKSHEIVKASRVHTEMLYNKFLQLLQDCGWNMDIKELQTQHRYILKGKIRNES